jgi:formylglycine-generating enzyme required for sulfatase activity
MRRTRLGHVLVLGVGIPLALSSPALAAPCPAGTVPSGSTCIDRYEASLWKFTQDRCITLIKKGKALPRSCFTSAVQLGLIDQDYTDAECKFNGGGCKNIFALSLPNMTPAHAINYFVAAAACRNSGKRLPSNAEWQAAALGTPDPWPQDDPGNQCNLETAGTTLTGARSKCVSDVGAYDMVGNVIEFVADWGPLATTGANWDVFIAGFGGDVSNIGGSPGGTIYGLPGTTLRGGSFSIVPNSGGTGLRAGVYAIDQNGAPNSIGDGSAAGFRCAK